MWFPTRLPNRPNSHLHEQIEKKQEREMPSEFSVVFVGPLGMQLAQDTAGLVHGGAVHVTALAEGGAASRAGVQSMDTLLSVQGETCDGKPLSAVTQMIYAAGKPVCIAFRRSDGGTSSADGSKAEAKVEGKVQSMPQALQRGHIHWQSARERISAEVKTKRREEERARTAKERRHRKMKRWQQAGISVQFQNATKTHNLSSSIRLAGGELKRQEEREREKASIALNASAAFACSLDMDALNEVIRGISEKGCEVLDLSGEFLGAAGAHIVGTCLTNLGKVGKKAHEEAIAAAAASAKEDIALLGDGAYREDSSDGDEDGELDKFDKPSAAKNHILKVDLHGTGIDSAGAAVVLRAMKCTGGHTKILDLSSNAIDIAVDPSCIDAVVALLNDERACALEDEPLHDSAAALLPLNHWDHEVIPRSDVTERDAWLRRMLTTNGGLETLILADNHIRDIGLARLAKGLKLGDRLKTNATCLTELDLSNTRLTDVGAKSVAEILLRQRCVLKLLNLSGNDIHASGVSAIARSITRVCASGASTLTRLELAYNTLGPAGGMALAQALERGASKALTALDLEGCCLRTAGVVSLAKALQSPQCANIRIVNVAFNDAGVKGCMAVASALAQRDVRPHGESLKDDRGWDRNAEAHNFEWTTEQASLDLSGNELGDEGAFAVAKALGLKFAPTKDSTSTASNRGDVLEKDTTRGKRNLNGIGALCMSHNNIGNGGAAVLGKLLERHPYPELHSLVLSDNSIGNAGVRALGNSLRATANRSLTLLDLADNAIEKQGLELLLEMAQANDTLTEIVMQGNPFQRGKFSPLKERTLLNTKEEEFWSSPTAVANRLRDESMQTAMTKRMEKFHRTGVWGSDENDALEKGRLSASGPTMTVEERDASRVAIMKYEIDKMAWFNRNWVAEDATVFSDRKGMTVSARQAVSDYERHMNGARPVDPIDLFHFIKRRWAPRELGGRGDDQLRTHRVDVARLLAQEEAMASAAAVAAAVHLQAHVRGRNVRLAFLGRKSLRSG